MGDTIRFGNLTVEISQTPGEVVYTFAGDVDEHFRHKDVPRIRASRITFVLENVNNFNSCGIREWIYLVRDVGALGQLRFVRCSVTMIDQINMVPDSLGQGTIDSFYAPYFCPEHSEVNRLITLRDHLDVLTNKQAPPMKCEQCSKALEFDALEDTYFLFVGEDSHFTKSKAS